MVLPAPFGPITIQRSSSCAVQSTLRSNSDVSRRTDTPRSLSTSSDTAPPHAGPAQRAGPNGRRDRTYATARRSANQVPQMSRRELVTAARGRPGRRYREDEMNQPRTTLLITLTGRDRPGVTSRLFSALARFPLSVADIEQVTIRGRLVLGVLRRLRRAARPDRDLPRRHRAGRRPRPRGGDHHRVGGAAVTRVIAERVNGRLHVTVLGSPLLPDGVAAVAGRIAASGANIDRITRLASDPVTCVELDVSGAEPGSLRQRARPGGRRQRRGRGRAARGPAPAGDAADRDGRRLHADPGRGHRPARGAGRLRRRGGQGDRVGHARRARLRRLAAGARRAARRPRRRAYSTRCGPACGSRRARGRWCGR